MTLPEEVIGETVIVNIAVGIVVGIAVDIVIGIAIGIAVDVVIGVAVGTIDGASIAGGGVPKPLVVGGGAAVVAFA